MIYKVFGLHPEFLAYSSQNPWKFLSVKSDKDVFCYFNEVAFVPHSRVGSGCQVIRGLELLVPPLPPTSEEGRGAED